MLAKFAELNTRKIVILIVLAMVAIRLGWSAVSPYLYKAQSDTDQCKALEQGIHESLAKANYCDTNSDCNAVAFSCPFSCNTYVNAAIDSAPLKERIKQYNAQCGFCVEECIQAKPVCVEHHCISFATLPAKEDQQD